MPSVEQLAKLLEAEPNDPFTLYAMAQEHARLGRHREAAGWYDRCLAADAGYCYAYYHKARSLVAAGDEAGARRCVEDGIAAARRVGDRQALGELQALADEVG